MKDMGYRMYGLKCIRQYRTRFWAVIFQTHRQVQSLARLRDRLNLNFSMYGYNVTTVRREPYLSRKGVSITVVID